MKYSKDYYKILGVAESAKAEDIKKEYRKLAIQFHPDKNKGNKQAEERFKEISEAYYVLSDQKRRAEYDQYRKFGGSGPGGRAYHGADGFDFEELLRNYGGGGRRAGRTTGRTQNYSGFADIFEELFGSMGGGQDGSPFGYGGGFQQEETPEDTGDENGSLKLSAKIAREGGKVKIRSKDGKTIAVTIPKNSKNGTKLRLSGLGRVSQTSGRRGDLILQLKVTE